MQQEVDKDLQSLFEGKSRSLPEEPFLGNILRLIERQRFRRVCMQWLILVMGLLCCALMSPIFIKGSILLSNGLGRLFESAENFFAAPEGMIAAVLGGLLFLISKRRLLYRQFSYFRG